MTGPLVFVTSELDPYLPGGAGAVIAGLAGELSDSGRPVVVRLVTTERVDATPRWLRTVAIEDGEVASDGAPLAASKAACKALRDLTDEITPAAVEFQDFDGLAFWTLTHREAAGVENIPVGVRYHLPADHILDAIGATPPSFAFVRVMERESLAAADFVISQTRSMAPVIAERYGLRTDRLVIGPPPVPPVERVVRPISTEPSFAVVGRLSEQKGVHDLVAELGPLLEERTDVTIEFFGSDGWSATRDMPMSDRLVEIAPASVRDRLVFHGPVSRAALPSLLAPMRAVLVPSRLESFCLVAHEVRNMGVPLIIRDQPAISEHFDGGRGAVLYGGDHRSLTEAVATALDDPATLDEVIVDPVPPPDAVAVYADLPGPRPQQAQAGLATAALYRIADVEADDAGGPSPMRRAAAAGLRAVPQPVARFAMSVVPRGLKERFRTVASWPAEQERRARLAKLAAIRSRIEHGDFADIPSPDVSVVIPCFNQGDLVEDAVASVFEQVHDSWEIIIVNDGSTDGKTTDRLRLLDYPRVTLIEQANTGLPGARNAAIEAARGRYIVPLDADDELLPHYMSTLIEALEEDRSAGFAHCWAELFGDVNWVWATRPFNPYLELLSNGVLQTAMMRADAVRAVGGYDATLTSGNEDWDMWLRMQEAGWTNARVAVPLYRYRKSGISMSVTNEAGFEEGRRAMIDRHPSLYDPDAVRAAKAAHFPLISVVVDGAAIPEIPLEDVQLVCDPHVGDRVADDARRRGWSVTVGDVSTPCSSARAATGKYVTYADGPSLAGLPEAIDTLEHDDTMAAAATRESVTVYRRWAIIDRTAPFTAVPDHFVDCQEPSWYVPGQMTVADRTLDVVRQRPEEAGSFPEWLRR